MRQNTPIFSVGQTVATPAALDAIADAGQTPDIFIRRHQGGDWGDVCEDDAEANELALKDNSRLLSVYHTARMVKLYVITEWDRSATTILLPEEY
tara:strand:- start:23309 stop:23593 length:285 start_codon:yes stop_codon:yes gene_type:complete